jgi:methylenetetrahydrofolate--tRNA-(uracil-5-)-methyltransferase
MVTIVGGGLAGCEAAWQVASRGVQVELYEMRPVRGTAVHRTDRLAELVCSNSFRSDKLDNAVGLLKEEMRRLGSLVMRAARSSRIPAGAALAVDRNRFADAITRTLERHPLVTLLREEVTTIPPARDRAPVVVATGPLTSDALAADMVRLVGAEQLYFYDAISPIVLADSIDHSKVFRASRWNRSLASRAAPLDSDSDGERRPVAGDSAPAGAGDYLNCPLTPDEYERFFDALVHAQSATLHDFDRETFFEGCLPIEVMAHRGNDTLRFGPMKPVGLVDPRTGRQPYAVVQLRQDTLAGDHYSLVGFQTQITWGEQARVLRMIPGLERAEFVRFGMVHRNTYVNGPRVLADTWQVRRQPALFLAGQMSGVEGYVESAASGLLAGLNAAAFALGRHPRTPPRSTAIGALAAYVSRAEAATYQPSNITFGIMQDCRPDGGGAGRAAAGRHARRLAVAERALNALEQWISESEDVTIPGLTDSRI